jgi:16S rRNA (cytidine1402-2'-O)-methyltransferase
MEPGTLYIVATPIGNLEDLTFRALRVLKEVDLVAAEDTRHSRKLFSHYGIATPLTPYHEHNEERKTAELLELLRQGRNIALITDAGTPAVADPGYRLVRACREAGLPVAAVPGPAAVTTALSVAGLPTDRFAFEGFLPSRAGARREKLRALRHEARTVALYETPHRLVAALRDVVEELGAEREVAVVRELTKLHEEVVRGGAGQVLADFAGRDQVRGEIVLLLAPAAEPEAAVQDVPQALRLLLEDGVPLRQAVKQVAKASGQPGDEVYRQALEIRSQESGDRSQEDQET